MPEKFSRNVLAIAAATLATGALAYVIYFDYKRRNDTQFRRKLRKEKKRVDKTVAQEAKESASSAPGAIPIDGNITPDLLRAAYDQATHEDLPTSVDGREAYFMTQVGMGEQLVAQGPSFFFPAAISFYKALRIYPSDIELLTIYSKTIPEAVHKIVVDLHNLDAFVRLASYYEYFPPKSMNVEIKSNDNGRKVLLVTKDIAAGETIYKEYPVVAVLDADLEASGKYCSHCFRPLDSSISPHKLPEDQNPLGSTFCSEQCLDDNKTQSTSLLFTQDPPLPSAFGPSSPVVDNVARKEAQDRFIEHLKAEKRSIPLLAARFIARQIGVETAKLAEKVQSATFGRKKQEEDQKKRNDFTDAIGGDFLLAEHMEKLRYLAVQPDEEGLSVLSSVLEKTLPGLEQFVTDERHSMLFGKMAYNAIGVGNRDDKPEPAARPEDVEKTRTSVGTQHQVGSAFYTLSSYANHSCAPSATLTFPSNTTELHVIATQNLKMGDEVTVAYVDVSQHHNEKEQETIPEARRRRRMELARGWKFACACVRCEEEGKELSQEQKKEEGKEVQEGKDESRVEEKQSPIGVE